MRAGGGGQLAWNGDNTPSLKWPKVVGCGGTLGLFAPSHKFCPQELERAVATLRGWGFQVKIPKGLNRHYHYLAGETQHRLDIFKGLMEDDQVDGLLAVRGGFGCQHLLPHLKEYWPKWTTKAIFGFSDLTALHLARYQATGVLGYHAPVAVSLGKATLGAVRGAAVGADRISQLELKKTFLAGLREGSWIFPPKDVLKPGVATGPLLGGNLTLITALLASPWLPDFSGAILMVEEVDEPAYRLDRLLTTLKHSPIWNQAQGLVFGKLARCGTSAETNRLLKEAASDFNGPVIRNASFSHLGRNRPFPVGAIATLEAHGSQS